MIVIPKRTKYKKYQKNLNLKTAIRGTSIAFGTYGLQSLSAKRITAQQIEAVKKVINRKIKYVGKLWMRIFPHFPVTSKPSQVRMGKGKGEIDHWIANVKKNQIILEITSPSPEIAKQALQYGQAKLPIKTKIIFRENK